MSTNQAMHDSPEAIQICIHGERVTYSIVRQNMYVNILIAVVCILYCVLHNVNFAVS